MCPFTEAFLKEVITIEEKLKKRLAGKRLICESTFSREEVDAWRQQLVPQGALAWVVSPTTAAVATVGTGMYHYRHGDFWSAFPGLDTPADQTQWGQQFKRFVGQHESLETFQNLPGLTYVAPILAHGGIPQYCLPDFFDLLTHYGDPELPSADFIDLLGERPAIMVNIDMPVRRFLLHGGEVAEEFVARCLALWQSRECGDGGGTHGLPSRVIDVFSQWYSERGPTQRQHIRRFPKPEIRMRPGDLWVYLFLPRCDDHPEIDPNDCWEADGKNLAVSRVHEIPLLLADNWSIELKGMKTILQGLSDSEPVLFFDADSKKMIPNPRLRRLPEHLWAVFSQLEEAEPRPSHTEEIPTWPGYVVAVFNLEGQKYLKIGEHQYDVRRPFFHGEEDPVVEGVATEEGLPVFHSPPKIAWEGEANFSLIRRGHNEVNIDISSNNFQMWFDESGEYEFTLRGPLGQNIHKRFMLIPGLKINLRPEAMWPNTTRIECDVSVEQGDICSADGRTPPIISCVPRIRFQVIFEKTQVALIANVPRLRWRVLSEEASEWDNKLMTLFVKDLERADYPRLVCEMGQFANEIEVDLEGRHGFIHPPQGQHSAVSQQDTWAFDLRMVLDQVRQSGLAEEFDISVHGSDNNLLYRGKIMTVRPEWDLQEFRAEWKKQDEGQHIRVSWRENGNAIAGRWLVLIPLWRTWEGVIHTHKLSDEERGVYEWNLLDIYPGRYVVRAVHAPWGCEDWIEAKHAAQQIVDTSKDSWEAIYDLQEEHTSVEEYTETLLAHWYRPQLVRQSPQAPAGLSERDIQRFLTYMRQTHHLEAVQIPRDGSGSLNIFLQNAKVTTDALENEQNWPQIWEHILPSKSIVDLTDLSPQDKIFILELVVHWVGGFDAAYFQKAAKDTIKQVAKFHMQAEHMSKPIEEWFLNVKTMRRQANRGLLPKPDDIIFLCERFSLIANASDQFLIGQYRKLKAAYQCREAI